MIEEEWIDRGLIAAVSGLIAFLIALGVVRVWRAFTGGGGRAPRGRPENRRRFR